MLNIIDISINSFLDSYTYSVGHNSVLARYESMRLFDALFTHFDAFDAHFSLK